MREPKITILISMHKDSYAVNNTILKSIQVGCALTENKISGIYHDDEGDSLSHKNRKYCELTAQYWAYKNLDCDYYGFFHYRRYLAFLTQKRNYDCWGDLVSSCLDKAAIKEYGLDEETMRSVVSNYDVILPEKKDILKMPRSAGKNMREQYVSDRTLNMDDLDIMVQVVHEKYPEYDEYMEKYLNGHESYLNNIFIMKKELFLGYANWVFDILEECDRRIDTKDYSVARMRTLGHLSERLLNVYLMPLMEKRKIKYKELQTVMFIDTEPSKVIRPAFEKNNVAIAIAADDYYVPYVSVVFKSIAEHTKPQYNYDIMVMTRNITEVSEHHLENCFEGQENISLRFINVSKYESIYKRLPLRGHFKIEVYFRLLMPELLPYHEKVLYIDSDIVVLEDLAELYITDLKGYMVGACLDPDTAGLYNGYEPGKKHYMDSVLKIKKPYSYFQAGVLLLNLDEFRAGCPTEKMLKFALSYEWELQDQDVLNYLCQGKIKYVDMSWNVMVDMYRVRIPQIISRGPKWMKDKYMEARINPKIVHYAGPEKPWTCPWGDFAEIFWDYAKKTPYYEEILYRMSIAAADEELQRNKKQLKRKIVSLVVRTIDKTMPVYSERRKLARIGVRWMNEKSREVKSIWKC